MREVIAVTQESICTKIRNLRHARGLTQAQLSDCMQLPEETIRDWESGRSAPEVYLIPQLAKHLQIEEHVLTGSLKPTKDNTESVHQRKNTLRLRSILSVAVSIVGVLLAVYLNFQFQKPFPAFFSGAAICLIASVTQAYGLIQKTSAKLGDYSLFRFSLVVFCIDLTLFSILLPLLLTTGTQPYLPPLRWLIYGSAFASITGAACLVSVFLINRHHGIRTIMGIDYPSFFRYILLLVILLAVLALMHVLVKMLLARSNLLYPEPLVFSDWNSFRDYMQQPLTKDGKDQLTLLSITPSDGNLIYTFSDPSGNTVIIRDALQHIYLSSESPTLCSYLHFNQFVYEISFSESYNLLPVQILTNHHKQHADRILTIIDYAFSGLYLLTPLVITVLLIRKRHKTKNNDPH